MAYRIQIRRDTSSNWTSNNPILLQGEFGYELNTGYAKIGDGQTAWTALDYFGGTGPTGSTGLTGVTGSTGSGVPAGGSAGQFLVKATNSDYDTAWTSSLASNIPPGSSGATGATGQLSLDSDWLYVCIATDTWKRTLLTGW
jgi:hypothetical protein